MGLIRILLSISIVIAHTSAIFGINLVGGQIAVESFFIISGFYMSLILNEKYIGFNNSYKLYLTNRLLRLYPIYWAVIILVIVRTIILFLFNNLVTGSLGEFIKYYNQMNFPALLYLGFTNVFLVGQDAVMFLGLNIHSGNLYFTSDFTITNPRLYSFLFVPQAWTIGVEIIFYLIAPLIVRQNIKFIFVFILLSLGIRIFLIQNGLNKDPWTYRFFPAELLFFLLGSCSYKMYTKIKELHYEKFKLYLITSVFILFTIFYNNIRVPYEQCIYFIIFSFSLPFIFILTKNGKWDGKLGELSYPIYISHLFILSLIADKGIIKHLGTGLVVLIITIFFSILLNYLISKPIEKIRQQRVLKRSMLPIYVSADSQKDIVQ